MKRIILVFSKKIFICIISAIAVISSFAQNDNNPLVFMHSDGVYLRWKGYREIDLSGYRVYRKEQGEVEWTQLTAAPLRMATTTKEINDLLGYKSELYFSLFEKKPGETIQPADFGRWKNEKDRSLFEVTCLVNPEFGLALGEIFKDATAVIGKRYQYKITVLSSKEKDWASSPLLPAFFPEKIPVPAQPSAVPSDKNIVIEWPKNKDQLTNGTIVSYKVLRSEKSGGPFLKQNLYNLLPVTINTEGGKKQVSRESWTDFFAEKDKVYYYRISSVNAFGLESEMSAAVSSKRTNSVEEWGAKNISFQKTGSAIHFSWTGTKGGNAHYEVLTTVEKAGNFQSVQVIPASASGAYSWLDTKALDGADYYCFIKSIADDGKSVAHSDTIHIIFSDLHPPGEVKNVKSESLEGGIHLSWQPNKDPDIKGYIVEEKGPVFSSTNFILTRAPIVETSYTDSLHPADQGWHTYLVYAVDQHNNRSRKGSEVRARAIDKYPPSAPELKSISESNGIITLNWEQFPTGDLKEFIVVSKRKDSGNFIEEKRTGQLSADLKIPEDGYYSFWIIAQDSSGNQSEKSSSLSIDYLREKQLPAPTSGNAVKDGNKVIIMWKPSESNQIKGIFIRRKNLTTGESKDIGEFAKTENQFRDLYILPGNNYRYEVMSFDQDFLFSAPLIIEYPKKK